MQPVIGITMCIDENKIIRRGSHHNVVRMEYGEAVRAAGGQPIYIDPSLDPMTAAKLCDGIVISGGEDIDQTLYGQTNTTGADQEPRRRTDWERQLIAACDEWRRPILGICYGEQLLNVHYGGTLDQDVTIRENAVDHGRSEQAAMHRVTFSEDFLGYSKGQQITVAARHHQAVAALAPGFVAVAYADDGCVEAIAGNGHVGVQWHSESDDTAPQVYGQFVQRCIAASQVTVPVKRVAKPNVVTQLMARIKR